MSTESIRSAKVFNVRSLTMTALMAAVATVLMFLSFSVPLMPGFIKLDFSELPALIAAFAFGPVSGVLVCLVKNLVNLLFTTTGGVGELCNFLLGVSFVLPAGLVYGRMKNRKGALIGATLGAVAMALFGLPLNYYVTYPIYTVFLPMDTILAMYRAINPRVENLWQALLVFNMPFTFIKGMLNVGLSFLIYKRISVLLKGKR